MCGGQGIGWWCDFRGLSGVVTPAVGGVICLVGHTPRQVLGTFSHGQQHH